MAISVELLVNSSAWQAASRPTLRRVLLLLFIYTVSGVDASDGSDRSISGERALSCRAVSKAWRASRSTTAGRPRSRDAARAEDQVTDRARALDHLAQRFARRRLHRSRSTRTAAASTAASTATPGPSHAYLELSPGLDFETKLFAKTNAAELLREELAKPGYQPSPIALGANTDCYQPIERKYKITRSILEVLAECEHPVTIVTKSALIERDLDLLAPMAQKNLVKVFVSIGTLDRELARKLEPRAASPQRRLDVLQSSVESKHSLRRDGRRR